MRGEGAPSTSAPAVAAVAARPPAFSGLTPEMTMPALDEHDTGWGFKNGWKANGPGEANPCGPASNLLIEVLRTVPLAPN